MSKNKILAKNTIILGIGQFVPKIIALVTLPILTRVFSTNEYGIYDLILSFASLALPIMTLLIQQAVFRFLISEKDNKICKSYITNSIIFVIFLCFALFCIVNIIGIFFKTDFNLIVVIFLLYFSESLYDLLGQVARGLGKNLLFSTAVIIYSIVNMIFLLIALCINCINIINVIIILISSYIFAIIFLGFKLNIKELFDIKLISLSTIKKMLIYSVPIIPSSISLWIVNLSDRLIITYFWGEGYNGIYSAATKVPNLFGTVFNIFNLAWTELASRSIDEDCTEYYSKLFKNLYSFLIGIMIALITFSPIIFNLLIDSKFDEGYFQMPILFIGVLINCFVSFYGGLYIALKKTKQVGMSAFVGCALNIIINLIFVRKIGLYAASISTVLSFFVILIYRFFETKKFIKIKYNYYNILIGIIFLIVSIINFYKNNIIFFGLNLVIAVIYNLFFNDFLIYIKNILISKITKKNYSKI